MEIRCRFMSPAKNISLFIKSILLLVVVILNFVTQVVAYPLVQTFYQTQEEFYVALAQINAEYANRETQLSLPTSGWMLEHDSEILLLHGDVVTPIVYAHQYTLSNNDRGIFHFNSKSARALTNTPIVSIDLVNTQSFSKRPTLFVSIHGAFVDNFDIWQEQLNDKVNDLVAIDQQTVHFLVNWDSEYPITPQSEDLTKHIKGFLNDKQYEWDVVLVGHSRGAIFTHLLSEELVKFNKVNKLYSVLIDPTAATVFGDFFPTIKPSNANRLHFGVNLFDGLGWLGNVNIGTTADMNIAGYHNILVSGTNHTQIAGQWVNGAFSQSGFSSLVETINQNKDSGTFYKDGIAGLHYVNIEASDFSIDGGVDFVNGELTGDVSISIGQLSSGITGSLGVNGAEVTANLLLASSYTSLQQDRIEISRSGLAESASVSISESGISTQIDTLGVLNVSVTTNLQEFATNIEVFGENIDLSVDHGDFNFLFIDGLDLPAEDFFNPLPGLDGEDFNPLDPGGIF